jgi:hypothetical protein
MNNWEKLKIITTLVATIIIPVVIGFTGNDYTRAIKEREIEGKFVELSVNNPTCYL